MNGFNDIKGAYNDKLLNKEINNIKIDNNKNGNKITYRITDIINNNNIRVIKGSNIFKNRNKWIEIRFWYKITLI